MAIDAALCALDEAMAVNRHLMRQVSADRDLSLAEATDMLIALERDRVELKQGWRILKTYGLAPMALVRRAA